MNLRGLPSVEQLLQTQPAVKLITAYGRPLTLQAIRIVLADVRARASTSEGQALPDQESILTDATSRLDAWTCPTLVSVINASGVILHTNLGRAPLSSNALQAIEAIGRGYSNLEMDLQT